MAGFDLSTAKPAGAAGGFDLASAAPEGPTDRQKDLASRGSRFVQGMRDPVDAGAQLLTHILPQSVVDAGNDLNNWASDKFGIFARLPERNLSGLVTGKTGGIDQLLKDRETEYQGARTATGNTGIDWARIGGNIASPANLAIAGGAPAAATTAGKLGIAAATGATMSALTPVTEGDFTKEKLQQIAMGAGFGPAASVVGSAAARVVKPVANDAVKTLMSEGITPTPGQILGGRWQVLEDKAQSLPLVGDAIASARRKGLDELNTAAYARALEPIGGKVPTTVGRDAVNDVRTQIGDAYDALLPKVQFKADSQFAQDLQSLHGMAQNLPPEQAARFERVLKNQVIGKMTPQGSMDGATLKGIESDIGSLATGLRGDASFDNRQLGAALGEVQAAIRSNLERANPDYADALKATNTAWANFKRVQNASSKVGAEDGVFTPSQLQNAVRTLDRSKEKRAFSEGDALMQDLSDPAKQVLASKYPDSGTAGRLLMNGGVMGGAAMSPTVQALLGNPLLGGPAALALGSYLPGGRQLAAWALAGRQSVPDAIPNAIKRIAPAASPAFLGLSKP